MSKKTKEKEIKAVLCEPHKLAVETNVPLSYESLSKIVGGSVCVIELIKGSVIVLLDGDAQLKSSPLNRAIFTDPKLTDLKDYPKPQLLDIISGTFLVCGFDGECLISLTDEQIEDYKNLYMYPQLFGFFDGGVIIHKVIDETENTIIRWSENK